jgi:dienelactone hydrolase
VQVHVADKDPIRSQSVIDSLAAKVRQSGATFELFDYDAPGHLFADPAFPAYSRDAANLLTTRVLAFLDRLDSD